MSDTPIPRRLKAAVVERDGTVCLKCGMQTTGAAWTDEAMHIDHIVPEVRGGLTTLDNLQVLCRKCNLAKGDKIADYRVSAEQFVKTTVVKGHAVTTAQHRVPGEPNVWIAYCECGISGFNEQRKVTLTESAALGALQPHLKQRAQAEADQAKAEEEQREEDLRRRVVEALAEADRLAYGREGRITNRSRAVQTIRVRGHRVTEVTGFKDALLQCECGKKWRARDIRLVSAKAFRHLSRADDDAQHGPTWELAAPTPWRAG